MKEFSMQPWFFARRWLGYALWMPGSRLRRRSPFVLWALAIALGLVWVCSVTGAVLAGEGDPVYVVVKAGRVITAAGKEHQPGIIVIEDGKITAVGDDLDYPPTAKVIDARTQTVMPGFVHPRSRYHLPHYNRNGVHGDQSAATDVYLKNMDFDDLLEAGYTTVCFMPDGKDIPGTAAAYRTAGPEANQPFEGPRYLHVRPSWSSSGKKMLRGALKKAKEEIEKVEKARKEWEEKQKQKKANKEEKTKDEKKPKKEGDEKNGDTVSRRRLTKPKPDDGDGDNPKKGHGEKTGETEGDKEEDVFKPPPIDPKYQPLVDLLQKKAGAQLMIELTKASDLLHLDDVLEGYDELPYTLYLSTALARSTDFHRVVNKLGERKARVLLNPSINRMPYTTFRYNLAAELTRAGCEVSTVPWSDSRTELRRARRRLAELARSGLDREAAVKSMTMYPARSIGLDGKIGSIEKDKDADLVFLDGDPLDPLAQVRKVMILGEMVWDAEKNN